MLYYETSIKAQKGIDQRLSQVPFHHGWDTPGMVRVSKEKDGVRILDGIMQPQHICPGGRQLKIVFTG